MDAIDLRWLTGILAMGIGLVIAGMALWLWDMPPKRRVDIFAPFATSEGLELLLRAIPAGFFFGLFLIMSGCSKWTFYWRSRGFIDHEVAYAASMLETLLSVLAIGYLLRVFICFFIRRP